MGADELDSAYPRQDQYGYAGQRCKWCGRHTPNAEIWGVYCTPLCRAADNYASHICFELFLVIISIIFFWMLALGTLPPSEIFGTTAIFVVLVALTLLMLYCLKGARKMRKKSGLWH
ncbi:MAG: hypothetical protein GQ580_03480 [Candidatus Thorarchaeota archaeon]|nr:hypothetical protein [Candidatus Thorarchaeota archaeon]